MVYIAGTSGFSFTHLFWLHQLITFVCRRYICAAVQSQKTVSAYFTSKQIRPFGFADQCGLPIHVQGRLEADARGGRSAAIFGATALGLHGANLPGTTVHIFPAHIGEMLAQCLVCWRSVVSMLGAHINDGTVGM